MPKQVPQDELDTNAVLKNAIAANKALVEMKGAGERIFLKPKLLGLLRGQENDMLKRLFFLDTILGYVQAMEIALQNSYGFR